jgi:anti-sigma factor RsiW
MNCRRVEKLIPLYVEGDLESQSRERIASHLEWCGRCNWLADEFRESQSWLHSTQPPEFDEAFLNSLKADALKLIAESNSRPSLLASLIQQWSRRQVFALAGAVIIVVAVVVLYVYQASTSGRLQIADTTKRTELQGARPEETQSASGKTPDTGVATGADLKKPRRSRHHRSVNALARSPVFSTEPIESPLASNISRSGGSGPGSFEPSLEPSGSGDDSPAMLRIEIQTSDPNIRIIWFAPKEVENPKTDQ